MWTQHPHQSTPWSAGPAPAVARRLTVRGRRRTVRDPEYTTSSTSAVVRHRVVTASGSPLDGTAKPEPLQNPGRFTSPRRAHGRRAADGVVATPARRADDRAFRSWLSIHDMGVRSPAPRVGTARLDGIDRRRVRQRDGEQLLRYLATRAPRPRPRWAMRRELAGAVVEGIETLYNCTQASRGSARSTSNDYTPLTRSRHDHHNQPSGARQCLNTATRIRLANSARATSDVRQE